MMFCNGALKCASYAPLARASGVAFLGPNVGEERRGEWMHKGPREGRSYGESESELGGCTITTYLERVPRRFLQVRGRPGGKTGVDGVGGEKAKQAAFEYGNEKT